MAPLDNYCGSPFWNGSLLDRPDPDLPLCFEQTVLVWVPLGFLWLCAPWHLVSLFRRTEASTNFSWLYICKQIIVGLLLLVAVADLAVTLGEDYGPTNERSDKGVNAAVLYANPVLFAVSWVVLMLCQESTRRQKWTVDSSRLLLFWLLLVVCGIFPFQTLLREALAQGSVTDLPRFCLFYISYSLQVLSLVLSAFADVSPEMAEQVNMNPERGASFLSKITFNWFNSMVISGYKRPLMQEDLWELNEEDSTRSIWLQFEKHMKQELLTAKASLKRRQNKASHKREARHGGLANGVSQDELVMNEMNETPSKKKKSKKKNEEEEKDYAKSWLVPSLMKTFKGVLIESAFFKLLQDLLSFLSPQLLKTMISFTQDKSIYVWKGYLYAVLLLLVAILQSLFLQQYFQRCFVLGMKVRTTIMAAIYKKALVVSNDTRKESTVGETVNLMSADAQRFNEVTNFVHLLWSCPLQIVLAVVFLWFELGPSVLAGLAVMVLMVPINGFLATKSRGFQV